MRSFRFTHIVVAALLGAASVGAVGVIQTVGATGVTPSSFIPIVPCRLADTRTGTEHVGVRAAAIGAGEAVTFAVWGTNGDCTIPSMATGIASNVTAVHANATSYLTVYPADADPRPTASNLNYGNGSPPIPNQVTVALSATGAIAAYNRAGTVDIIIDIVGYYQPATSGPPGPAGPTGATGATGPRGFSAWDTIPSGRSVTGTIIYDSQETTNTSTDAVGVDLPGIAPVPLTAVNFSASSSAGDGDATCTGSVNAPTAPAGKVCLYRLSSGGVNLTTLVGSVGYLSTRSFFVTWNPNGTANGDEYLTATWAYTAP